jgi:hypothetical protein
MSLLTLNTGVVCGSGDLNARMRIFAAANLHNEYYLEDAVEGITIDNIIDSEILPHFESEVKRAFDMTKDQVFSIRLRGLRESLVNPRLKRNYFVLTWYIFTQPLPSILMLIFLSEDLMALFDESFKTIETLLLQQIEHARRSNIAVNKVVLVGGFGDSPALKKYLHASLESVNNQHDTKMQMAFAAANTSAVGVAIGAVKRAQDKYNGPKRIPCRSIGVLYHVPDDSDYEFSPQVLRQRWSVCELSQEEYIMRTIKWIIKAVSFFVQSICHLPRN